MTTEKTTKHGAVKGTVAAAAGVAVLLGGMGTFALWNASNSLGTANVSAGHIKNVTASWVDWKDHTFNGTTADIASAITAGNFRMVPGDKIKGTGTVAFDASGTNLYVKPYLVFNDESYPVVDSGKIDVPFGESAESATLEFTLKEASDSMGKWNSSTGQVTTAGAVKLDATVTITYEADDEIVGGQNASMDKSIALTRINFTLQQVTPDSHWQGELPSTS